MPIYELNANLRIANKFIRIIRNLHNWHKIRIALASYRKGFTMIEMLVVVAIAGMILSGVMVMFQQARAKARDATREHDIKALQNALALYANTRSAYPVYDGALTGSDAASAALVNDGTIPQVPKDPLNQGTYVYNYNSADGTTYTLTYYLETDSISGKSSGENTAAP